MSILGLLLTALMGAMLLWAACGPANATLPDIRSVPADLQTPSMIEAEPAPGIRVKQQLPEYQGTNVYHALYLPTDWRPGGCFPAIVEYAGNGPYSDKYGDVSDGTVEGSNLGYGMSGGRGFIWVCPPFVNRAEMRNQTQWWGDVEATVDYCRQAVCSICEQFGGDPSAVILTGFSRGAIACGYIGLHDDSVADIWLAFVPYSHYDGDIETWPYPAGDRASAITRLQRLHGRASFVCDEDAGRADRVEKYLRSAGVEAPFTFQPTGFRNHNDAWILRDSPARRALRRWLADTVSRRRDMR